MFRLFLLSAVALSAGFLGSMLGVGGGFLMVPVYLFLGLSMHRAAALSLVAIAGISISSSSTYIPRGLVDFKVGVLLESITLIGAVLGPNLALNLREETLEIILGLILMYVAYRMWGGDRGGDERKTLVEKGPLRWIISLIGSFTAGLIAGMVGIGGGTIKVPIMYLILGLPIRTAVATSQFMISLTSVTSSSIYIMNGLVDLERGAAAVAGAITGAQLGSRLGLRIKSRYLKKMFSILLLIFSVTIVAKAFHRLP